MPIVNLYVGPTAYGLPTQCLAQPGLRVFPPARRGDIARLVQQGAGAGVLVLCDGVFQSEPAVSHAELCQAMDAQWEVWGVSSIGAIRACELRTEGMRGFGHVYAMLRRHVEFADDEMCHLHFPETPFFPVSEPLVNLRFALARCSRRLGVAQAAADATIAALRELWFGDRTLARMKQAMVEQAGIDPSTADAVLQWLEGNRVKSTDLKRLLTRRPWLGRRSPG